eukprot:5988668-Prymnesium_polylepis.1
MHDDAARRTLHETRTEASLASRPQFGSVHPPVSTLKHSISPAAATTPLPPPPPPPVTAQLQQTGPLVPPAR